MSACANDNATPGVVIRVEDHHVWVEARKAGCGQCAGQTACGSGLLGLRGQSRQYRLTNTINARVGDAVMLTVADGEVLTGALWAYAMPLGLGLLGAALAATLGGGDGYAALALLAGISAGWLLLRLRSGSGEPATAITLQFAPD